MSKEFLTVSEFNNLVKEVVTYGFPNALWICGEIQGYNRNRDKRHVFFEICEKNPDSQEIVARIGLVIFGNRKAAIESILKQAENAFSLKDDIEVKFLCKVDFYPPHGAVRLIVESIDPIYTLGKIAQQRQKLITELRKKGTLEKNKQVALPLVPVNIGLITSHDSAAYNDFVSELEKSGYAFKVFYINATMQGKRTEGEVCAALDRLNQISSIDIIVITRGGGSIADLSSFDSKKIAERIAASQRPVFSGIGHEIDLTITDLAAHTHQKTPTAIARFLVERVADFMDTLDDLGDRICDLADGTIRQEGKRLKEFAQDLHQGTISLLKFHREQMVRFTLELKRQPEVVLKRSRGDLKGVRKDVLKQVSSYFSKTKKDMQSYEKMIDFVHPKKTLKRGFSITRMADGKIIRSVKSAKIHSKLNTEVADGVITSQVVRK